MLLPILQRAAPALQRAAPSLPCWPAAWSAARCLNLAAAPASNQHTIPTPGVDHLRAEPQTSKYAQPINITQLDNLVRSPTLPRLVNSATFLKGQLPARLEGHLRRLQALQPAHPQLRALLHDCIDSKKQGLEVAKDWSLVNTTSVPGLHHFESHLASFKEHLEMEVDRMVNGALRLTESKQWWSQPDVDTLDRALDLCHWYLLGARVMLTQHSAALFALEQKLAEARSSGSSSSVPVLDTSDTLDPRAHYHEGSGSSSSAGGSSRAMGSGATTGWQPPHQHLIGSRPLNLIQRHAPLKQLAAMVVEDCRAFAVEKNSVAPEVEIVAEEGLQATLVVPYVEFVLMEVLKNALQATIDRYGAWDVDEADPVRIELREVVANQQQQVEIVITDQGNGIPDKISSNMYHYFWSSRQPKLTLYGYSRNHGATFQGKGVGVPMCRVYAHFMGGSIEWETDSWKRHTTMVLRLPKNGFTL